MLKCREGERERGRAGGEREQGERESRERGRERTLVRF